MPVNLTTQFMGVLLILVACILGSNTVAGEHLWWAATHTLKLAIEIRVHVKWYNEKFFISIIIFYYDNITSTLFAGQCRTCTDIVFAIDSSSSIGAENFQTLKNFMIDLANEFDYTSTRVGIFQYGSRVVGRRSLTNNKILVTRVLQNLPYIGGRRSTATAVSFARVHLAALGRRICDRKIFLVTAGTATDSRLIPTITRLVRIAGFDVITVGVTESVSEAELLTFALEKQDNVLTVDDFDSLGTLTTRSRDALIKTCRE